MASLSEAKTLGGIGSILVLLTPIPNFGFVIGIIGFILTLIAVKFISTSVGERRIFGDMVYSIILAIIAMVVLAVTVIGAVFAYFGYTAVMSPTFGQNVQPGHIVALIATVIPGLVAVWALLIASAVFLRRSYSLTAQRLNVGMFDTAALVYLIGAITAIIFIGLILIIVAEILFAVAFFSIDERKEVSKPLQPA